jgi:CheY-like chemotaxis protein
LDGDRQVALAVSDTGVGMTREVTRHLYEPFFTTKGPRRGTGLGLSTAYGIVQQSGGTISCTSEPGRGTTFVIALPRVAAPEPVAEAITGAPVPTSEGGHETVLLVEDEEAVRKVAQEVLELRGYRVLAAPDAAAALNRVESHPGPIELLLTDLVLPDMNGRDLAARVRAARPDSRVLYTSGYTDEIELLTGATGAGVLFLPKPYDPAGLLRSVRQVLGSPAR